MRSTLIILAVLIAFASAQYFNEHRPMLRRSSSPLLQPMTLRKNPEAYRRILVRRPVSKAPVIEAPMARKIVTSVLASLKKTANGVYPFYDYDYPTMWQRLWMTVRRNAPYTNKV